MSVSLAQWLPLLLLTLLVAGQAAGGEQEEHPLYQRVCGSPAVDGYAHVDPQCLNDSPTAQWFRDYVDRGGDTRDLDVHYELGSDIDGVAVGWGLDTFYAEWEDCAEACKAHVPVKGDRGFAGLPCNAFAYCAAPKCFEPDAYNGQHSRGNCWLKFTEGPGSPEINMRGRLPPDYKARHPDAPDVVQWVAGVVLPADVPMREGTFGPRWSW